MCVCVCENENERERERERESESERVGERVCVYTHVVLQGAGFTAHMASADSKHSGINHSKSIRKWKWTFIFSVVFAIPTFIIAFIPVEWVTIVPGLTAKELVLFALSTTVQVSGVSGKHLSMGGT